ncbi:protein mono-ADP-ribosyltransferase TIPARP-like [Cololabis saira]|uniref:protein mono-ADP-ribosyltransferase TIPARP-like n=1 Tax=Cololabis saira TaxID=129043 RepID=UPI002AD54155|nr:protein mono-ADP-ribosyltransferase TIPARP-like [Cololabis saira]
MADVPCTRGMKRRLAVQVETAEPLSKSPRSQHTSLLILEVPAVLNTSSPVWDAIWSKQADLTWSVSPYSVSVHLTPTDAGQKSSTTSGNAESTTDVAQTSEFSCGICSNLRSQIQSWGMSQDTSYVLLSPQNSKTLTCSCLEQEMPPDPTSASSLMVSLPLAFLQPQLYMNTSMEIPSTSLSPMPPPSELQVTPSGYRTKSSSSIHICDKFLLGFCNSGINCRMHHTPYPFHWQLWSISLHQWVDVPLHSQVHLERMYCDPDKEFVYLNDGRVRFALDFETMELNDLNYYDSIRRLDNSDCERRNPFFPSKWKIYWWNDTKYEEYKKNQSDMLLKKMSDKEPSCSFYIDEQEYTVDFTTMTQTNVSTNFKRDVTCRPVYRSPRSMQHHLKTGIPLDYYLPECDPRWSNFSVDPLEEFSSWYPPVWLRQSPEREFCLVDVPLGSRVYRIVQDLFHEGLPETKMDVVNIQQVQNRFHWDKYQRQKAHMQHKHTQRANSQKTLERHLFHGTTMEAVESICRHNFDPRLAGVNGNSHGFGSYFATTACTSHYYTDRPADDENRHMFLAKVLVGKVSLGRQHYRRPPPISCNIQPPVFYDACADSKEKPSLFVVFDSCQCYPYYLISYRELPIDIKIQHVQGVQTSVKQAS